MGESENAVKTQIWCAVTSYVLIAIIKKTETRCLAVQLSTDTVRVDLRVNNAYMRLAARSLQNTYP